MEIKKSPKIPKKFECSFCDYLTSNRKDFSKHNLSLKHQNNTIGNKMEIKNPQKVPTHYCCMCDKHFITYSGLWKHKKKCSDNQNNKNQPGEMPNVQTLTNMVLDVVKQNNELAQQNNNLTNKLFDIYKNNTLSCTNINSHNKTFNLNVFLNEQCKDAMNIMDFVDSLKIQLSDLENVGKVGFVDGISNIIIKNLKAIDVFKRPVHCSDSKRETIYVKDDNKWEKEDEQNKKLRKAIKHIAHKNSNMLLLFKSKYPDCIYSDSNKSDQYNKLIIESMGGQGINDIEKENKIIKNIAKETIINKI
jgi:hypothetical protein